jgi:hypothetical protein
LLRDLNNNFCCLGILCNIHAKEFPNTYLCKTSEIEDGFTYGGEFSIPPIQVQQWAGLYEKEITIEDNTDLMVGHLWKRNDGATIFGQHSFEEMADFIEKNL